MNISLAFTTWNSAEWIKRQLEQDYFNLSDGLINEIIILDDCSGDYDILKEYETDNIKIFRNETHLSPLLGRKNLVSKCKNEWVYLMDSDNFLVNSDSPNKEITLLDSFFTKLTSPPLKSCFFHLFF